MDLLATSANQQFINAAKQLFSSAFFVGKWWGDMMLLYTNVENEDLLWFKKRGIKIKYCEPINEEDVYFTSAAYNRFYLFKKEFKKYNWILYMDADIIVDMPLTPLLSYKDNGLFGAVIDIYPNIVDHLKCINTELCREVEFCFSRPIFNSGLIFFSSNIIKKDSFDKILSIEHKYREISKSGDQVALNVYSNTYFRDKVFYLPEKFNLQLCSRKLKNVYDKFSSGKLRNAILHFCGWPKPWIDKAHPYYKLWNHNLNMGDGFSANWTEHKKRCKG